MPRPRLSQEPAFWLAVAVAINSGSVALEGRWRLYSRLFGRGACVVHSAIILPAWLWFGASVSRVRPAPKRWPLTGRILEAIGAGLVGLGFRELGPASMVNGDLFDPGRSRATPSGVYRLLDHPIYLGYAVLLGGRALRAGSLRIAIVAIEAAVLLRYIEAPVEARARRARMRRAAVRGPGSPP